MIIEAWDRYRAWDKRSVEVRTTSQRRGLISLIAGSVAACLGALASFYVDQDTLGRSLAFLAAAAAAISAVLGRELLSPNDDKNAILARSTAEAIKSECFLAAAQVSPYDGPDAAERFANQIDELEKQALAVPINPLLEPSADDQSRPPEPTSQTPLTVGIYRTMRLLEQRDFFLKRAADHTRFVRRLHAFGIGAAILAALFGIAAGAGEPWLAPWIGALTTIASAVAAWGLVDRRNYLVASYEAMAYRLAVLEGRSATWPLSKLVSSTEELLRGQQAAWIHRMSQPAQPPAAPAQQDDSQDQNPVIAPGGQGSS